MTLEEFLERVEHELRLAAEAHTHEYRTVGAGGVEVRR